MVANKMPIRKLPIIFDRNVPKGKKSFDELKKSPNKYRQLLPNPPPKKTNRTFFIEA
jgi:hypothetical protein